MKIIIAGAGRVGSQLAAELSSQGHDLVMIEKNAQTAAAAAEHFDVRIISGNACEMESLRAAMKDGADMFIAVSESDEINLTSCLLAARLGAPSRIARIRNESWFGPDGLNPAELGIDKVIHPERETVEHLTRVSSIPGAFDYAEFAKGEVALIGFGVANDLPIVNMSILELREQFALDTFLIIGIYRNNAFIIPGGGDVVKAGDKLWLLIAKDTIPLALPVFRKAELGRKNRAVVLGASRMGLALAEKLKGRFSEVIMIEPDKAKARIAGEKLDNVRVLKSSGDEANILRELGPESINHFIAVTNDDRVNLMSGLLAKRLGVERVAVVTNETEYLPVMEAIGLDVMVNPHMLTAGAILRYLRGGIVHSVVKLRAGEAELIEYDVAPGSQASGQTVSGMGLPKGVLVGIALRGDSIIIPDGSTKLETGDRVVLVATLDKIPAVEKLFVPRSRWF